MPEDLLREINRGGFSTGYSGQSPERLKAHMKNQGKFDLVTLRAKADEPEIGGDYYGLPWPCWGTPQIKHPGTHTLYNTNLHAKDGGGTFRARFGVVYEEKQPDGSVKNVNLLAEGSYSKGSELTDGYPSSPTACSRSSAGTRISPRTNLRPSTRSAATTLMASAGRSICRAASSASRWSMA